MNTWIYNCSVEKCHANCFSSTGLYRTNAISPYLLLAFPPNIKAWRVLFYRQHVWLAGAPRDLNHHIHAEGMDRLIDRPVLREGRDIYLPTHLPSRFCVMYCVILATSVDRASYYAEPQKYIHSNKCIYLFMENGFSLILSLVGTRRRTARDFVAIMGVPSRERGRHVRGSSWIPRIGWFHCRARTRVHATQYSHAPAPGGRWWVSRSDIKLNDGP